MRCPVLKTGRTSGEVWGECPPPSANFIGEKPKKPRRLAWDQDISTCESCFPDHFNSEVE